MGVHRCGDGNPTRPKELGIKVYGTNFKTESAAKLAGERAHSLRFSMASPRRSGMPDPGALRRVFELWCQRNTRTESAPLRRLVTGHAPFFFSACHLDPDARFGVQDVPSLRRTAR